MSIIWSFISQFEGGQILTAYVPQNHGVAVGNSGTTISTGCDLGQMNLNDLKTLNLSTDLQNLLIPYLGLKKQAAINFLNQNPLTITQEQADELDNAMQTKFTNNLTNLYNNYSDVNFDQLNDQQATVIADCTYQYGLDIPAKCPLFWNACCNQQWSKVVTILRNFGDSYSNRRNAEADLLS